MGETLHQIAQFLIPAWPLIAACLLILLPEARARSSARIFALAGLALTLVLTPLLYNQDLLARWGCLLASTVPLLAWREANGRIPTSLNFLASAVIMLALCAKSVLPVACLTGCAALVLALNETLVTSRAKQAWEPMRLRLAGLVMTLLGTSLTTLGADPALLRLGDLFMAVGLCLLAGLGLPGTSGRSIRADYRNAILLDMLLCLSAVALMLRLPERDMTHMVLLLAGFAGLWICVLTDQDSPRISVALAIIAAALPIGIVPSLLFLTSAFALAAEPVIPLPVRRWIQCGLPPWPGFAASCMVLAGLARSGILLTVLCGLALCVLASRCQLTPCLPASWRDRAILLALLGLGLGAGIVTGWTTSLASGGALPILSDWPLKWRAP